MSTVELISVVFMYGGGFAFVFAGYISWRKNPGDGKLQMVLGIVFLLGATLLFVLYDKFFVSKTPIITGDKTVAQPPDNPIVLPSNSNYVSNYVFGSDIYTGLLTGGMPNDLNGQMKYANGSIYRGSFVDGKRKGYGTMTYSNRDRYVGDWDNDMRHGLGIYTFANGSKYDGNYQNDKRYGKGTYSDCEIKLPNGNSAIGTYIGFSKNDRFEGEGIFKFKDGGIYSGLFSENMMWEGTYVDKDGNSRKVNGGEMR